VLHERVPKLSKEQLSKNHHICKTLKLNYQTLHGITNLILFTDATSATLTGIGPAEAASAAAAVPVVAGGACALHPPAATAAATLTAVAAGQPGAGMLVALAHLHRLQQQRFTLRDKAHRLVLQF
jgi:hypothetical protein